jgi:hypothetical protein
VKWRAPARAAVVGNMHKNRMSKVNFLIRFA